MNLLEKLKETSVSVIPVMTVVIVLGLITGSMSGTFLLGFFIGGILLILGLTIFLLGVDLGIQPIGERSGAELTKKRNLPLLVGVAFIIGFLVTIAEPDIQVFGDQVKSIFPAVNKQIFVLVIALGLAIFIMIGLTRTILNISLKITMLFCYVIMFAVSFFVEKSFFGIAFDSGGATTGPLTVPFILALGLGVCSVRSGKNDGFGLTGIASIGPIFAVLIYGFIISRMGLLNLNSAQDTQQVMQDVCSTSILEPFAKEFLPVLEEASISILPIVVLFVFFQIFLIKMTKRQCIRTVIGLLYSYIGLIIFLLGVKSGFMQGGRILGQYLGKMANINGGAWMAVLIGTGFVLGAIVVCAEPAVWVLTEQVERVSGGTIKRKLMLVFLAVGTALAIGIALWRAVAGFDLKYVLIPGYAIALFLMIFSPDIFTGIAFDSGGVASGPLTSTFILSFTLSASGAENGNDAFGVIALVAMMPIIAIQLLGIIFKKKITISENKQEKKA
ncbi:MAG: DUF1538 domain-containing protein [Treponemataceae bacterium]